MKITILTLFPEMIEPFTKTSIIKRAIDKKLVEVNIVNIRDYSSDRLHKVDSTPIGGGAGMILQIEPLVNCLKAIKDNNSKVYLLSASGVKYDQKMAYTLKNEENIILICGHYEGVDERISNYIDGEICIGDYVITGGELASMVVADSIIRLIDGVIAKESLEEESFTSNTLEYPQYALPRSFDGHDVPDILFSGNHQAISEYRFKEAIKKTMANRADLVDPSKFSKKELKWFNELNDDSKLESAINKARKFMK